VGAMLGANIVMGIMITFGVWGNAHITVLPRAPTKLLEFLPRVSQPAINSSNSARDQASLVFTTPVQRAKSFVFSAVSETVVISAKLNPQVNK
jgi:hypothetical protein